MITITNDQIAISCFGEALDKIWWQGRQWAVTSHGIECRDGTYNIERERLWERGCGEYPWPQHMASKNWIDIHDFCTAFIVAIALHPHPARCEDKQFKPAELLRYCQKAIKLAAYYAADDEPTSINDIQLLSLDSLPASPAPVRAPKARG